VPVIDPHTAFPIERNAFTNPRNRKPRDFLKLAAGACCAGGLELAMIDTAVQ
jgi:hypothetical protein